MTGFFQQFLDLKNINVILVL